MGASLGVDRNVNTVSVTTTYTVGADVDQVIADATSAGFTITLTDFEDGAMHQVEVIVDPDDSSGNTITVEGNATVFSTSLSSTGTTSALLQTQADGTWFVVGDVSSVSAGAANSRAVSAGSQASTADSKAVSDSVLTSTADSKAVSNSVVISTLTTTSNSKDTSQSLLVSTADSKAVSDSVVISTLTTTTDSKDTSQSLLVSTADSKTVSNSIVISTLTTTTNSHVASLSVNLSTTTSTANSG